MSKANEKQVGGEHYKSAFQHWDLISVLDVPYLPATATKYMSRWRKKNGKQDLEKAVHYIEKDIEEQRSELATRTMLVEGFSTQHNLSDEERQFFHLTISERRISIENLRQARDIALKMIKRLEDEEAEKKRLADEEADRMVTLGPAVAKPWLEEHN